MTRILPHIWLTSIASCLGKTGRVDETRLPAGLFFEYARYCTK